MVAHQAIGQFILKTRDGFLQLLKRVMAGFRGNHVAAHNIFAVAECNNAQHATLWVGKTATHGHVDLLTRRVIEYDLAVAKQG